MSTSTDGGPTWSTPDRDRPATTRASAVSRVVQPDGTVDRARSRASTGTIARVPLAPTAARPGRRRSRSPRSASTASPAACARARCRPPRSTADGNVYVAWEDCRFRAEVLRSNDIVFSTSSRRRELERRRPGSRSTRVGSGGRPLHPRPGRRSRPPRAPARTSR